MPAEYFLHLVAPRVFPVAAPWDSGLPVDSASTSPFVVDRGWVGPAGTYIEEWSIRDGDTVLYRHPPSYIQVRGHQSVRRFSDTVVVPIALEPGIYDIIFVVEKYRMGSFVAEAASAAQLAAAAAAAKAPPPAPPQPKAPARPAPAPPATAPAAVATAAPAPPYTGEAPELVRERVLAEELAKGSDPRVAQARAKSAEMRARKAMTAAAAAPAPAAAAPAPAAAAPAPAPYTGEDPETVREKVLAEELAKGSDPRVAQARAKSAEMRARKAMTAAAAAPAPAAPAPAAAAAPPTAAPAPEANGAAAPAKVASLSRAAEVAAEAPPGGGGCTAEEAAVVRTLIYKEAISKGMPEGVAQAQAVAAEIRARRGPWWRPDWK